MLRLIKMTGKWYAVAIDADLDRDSELEDIRTFVEEGTPVLLVNELEDAKDLLYADGFDVDDVILADDEE